jgi:hypothetical protein
MAKVKWEREVSVVDQILKPVVPRLALPGAVVEAPATSAGHARCPTCQSDRIVDLHRGRVSHCLHCDMGWIPAHGKRYCSKKKCGIPLVLEAHFADLYYVCLACKTKKAA